MKYFIESSLEQKKHNNINKFNIIYFLISIIILLIIISIILILFFRNLILQKKELIDLMNKIIFKDKLTENNDTNFNSSNLNSREMKLYRMLCPKEVNRKKKF